MNTDTATALTRIRKIIRSKLTGEGPYEITIDQLEPSRIYEIKFDEKLHAKNGQSMADGMPRLKSITH